jgi:hypothetical protein
VAIIYKRRRNAILPGGWLPVCLKDAALDFV